MAIGGVARQLARRVDQHDDRKLEPLGLVHGHQAHAVAAVLEDRRLRRLGALGRLAQGRDEAAERQPAVGLVAPAEVGDVQHVGQGLLAAGPRARRRRARASRSAGRSACRRPAACCAAGAGRAARQGPRPPAAGAPPDAPAPDTGGTGRSDGDTRAGRRRRSRTAPLAASQTPTARRRATRWRSAPREPSRPLRGRETTCRRRAGAGCRALPAPGRTAG